MKSSLAGILTITLAIAAVTHAQEQSKPIKNLLLSGCLQPGADAATFKLTYASPSQRPSVEAATSASPAAIGTAGQAREYELTSDPSGKTDLKLSTYIGRRVDVTARPIEESAPGASSGRAVAGLTAEPTVKGPKPERLMVTAITRVSGSCP